MKSNQRWLFAEALLLFFLLFSLPAPAQNSSCATCHDIPVHYPDITCTGCHDGTDGTSREDLAHYRLIRGAYASYMWESFPVSEGARMIKKYSCRRCHRIDNSGASLASHLDMSVRRLTPEEIVEAIENPNDQMPDFRFSRRETDFLTNALLRYSRINPASGMVEVVHFGGGGDTEVFQTRCGGCHRLLSKSGALGKYSLAPFLSGIDTEYYPPLDNRTWNREMLSDWMDNPRKINPFAVMPVIELKAGEKERLMDIIWKE